MPTSGLVAQTSFIVDKRLGAVPIDRLLDVRTQLRLEGCIDRPTPPGTDRPVLGGSQTLQPGVAYPAELAPTLRYYLPQYRVATDAEGRPAVELRFDAGATDAVGSLSLTLTWALPSVATTFELRAIEHQVALTLRFCVPVQGDATPGIALAPVAGGSGFEHRVALQALVPAGNLLVHSVTRIADRALFDTVYQALCSPDQRAMLELQIGARVGVQTWRQVLIGKPVQVDQINVLQRNGSARFTEMPRASPGAPEPAVARGSTMPVRMATPAAAPVLAMRTPPLRAFTPSPGAEFTVARGTQPVPAPMLVARTRFADTVMLRPAVQRPTSETVQFARIDNLALRRVVADSDMEIDDRKVVPIRVVLDDRQQPVVVDADVKCAQSVPFGFDPALPLNAGVYVAEGYTAAIHLLLPITLSKDGRIYRVFQDNLMRDVVHVAPSEFRLQRELAAPYLPSLSFLASDFGTTGNNTEADVMYRVSMVYRLEPWLDPAVIELARAALAEQKLVPRFTTTIPADAKLTLALDLPGVAQARPAARIGVAGIDDTLDLDHDTFVRLWRERLAPPGGAIEGLVDYKLFDGTAMQVPVRMSLWDDSVDFFDVVFLGPVAQQPGTLRAQVRNRIESPVEIIQLHSALLAGGGLARPVDPASAIGKVLQPQGALQVDYESGIATPAPDDFDPTILGRPMPKFDALLRLLMVTPGYASLGFDVTVQAGADSFAAAAGADPITGLQVEFDDGTRTTLTPHNLQTEVSLSGRLLDQLMGGAGDSQRYFFRVTNLHPSGEGARTSWEAGQAGAPLAVAAAQVKLDF